MARRLRIGVDVDGVLVDFVNAFYQEASAVLGREIAGVQTKWDFEDCLNISRAEVAEVWASITKTPNWFYMNSRTLPGVAKYLPWLTENHDVYFITSRKEGTGLCITRQTQMFLDELNVMFPVVIVNSFKGLAAAALKLDIFLDDYIVNVRDVLRESPKTKVFLMDATYNKQYKGSFTRVESFEDFANRVETISNE